MVSGMGDPSLKQGSSGLSSSIHLCKVEIYVVVKISFPSADVCFLWIGTSGEGIP